MMKIGVIGGGTMGLGLAFRLGQASYQVTVLEGAPQLGGLSTWRDYGGFTWDRFYHVILRGDAHLIGLIRELGLEERLRWQETRTGFLWRGRHLSMSNHWEFLTFPALTLLDKLRLGAGLLYCQRINDPGPLERLNAADWLRGIFGPRVYGAIWEPLLQSKYGVLKDQMPATIMWATIRRYCEARSKGGGRECMGYLAGGLKTLIDALARGILDQGGAIHCAAPVTAIRDGAEGQVELEAGGQSFAFDRVISTVPTRRLGPLLGEGAGLPVDEPPRPRYLGVICLALVLRRALNPYYVTNLIEPGYPFTGIIGLSNLTGTAELGGRHLAMLPRYDVPESDWFKRPDGQIAGEFIDALRPIWPDIDENLLSWTVQREPCVQALWIDGPPTRREPARNEAGTIWSINAELAGRDTLNNNAVVGVVNNAAARLLQAFAEAPMAGAAARAE